jgi:hypothetical protein
LSGTSTGFRKPPQVVFSLITYTDLCSYYGGVVTETNQPQTTVQSTSYVETIFADPTTTITEVATSTDTITPALATVTETATSEVDMCVSSFPFLLPSFHSY